MVEGVQDFLDGKNDDGSAIARGKSTLTPVLSLAAGIRFYNHWHTGMRFVFSRFLMAHEALTRATLLQWTCCPVSCCTPRCLHVASVPLFLNQLLVKKMVVC